MNNNRSAKRKKNLRGLSLVIVLAISLFLSFNVANAFTLTDYISATTLANYSESTGLIDVVTGNYNATKYGGAGLTTDKTAFDLDGSGDYVLIPLDGTAVTDPDTGDFTISMWFNQEHQEISQRLFDSGGTGGGDEGIGIYFANPVTGSTDLCARVRQDDKKYTPTCFGDISENTWYHIVMTWDLSEETINVYLDNSNVVNDYSTSASDPLSLESTTLGIGIQPNDLDNEFDGKISDVLIFNKPLTSTEVGTLYNNGRNYDYFNVTETPDPDDGINIIINNPDNNIFEDNDTIEISYNITSNQTIENVSLLLSNETSYSFNVDDVTSTALYGGSLWIGRPKIERLGNGDLILVFRNSTTHGTYNADKWHIVFSDDEGETWSNVDHSLTGVPIAGFPINDGNSEKKSELIIAPNGDLLIIFKIENLDSTIYRSEDDGNSWNLDTLVWDDYNGYTSTDLIIANDHVVVNDTIYITGRTKSGHNGFVAKSTNDGDSWSIFATLSTVSNEVGIEHLSGNKFIAVERIDPVGSGSTYLQYFYDNGTVEDVIDIGSTIGEVHQPVLKKGLDGYIRLTGRHYVNSGSQSPYYSVTDNGTNWFETHDFNLGNYDSGYGDLIELNNTYWYYVNYLGAYTNADLYSYVFKDKTLSYEDYEIVDTDTTIANNSENNFNYDFSSHSQGSSVAWKLNAKINETSEENTSERIINFEMTKDPYDVTLNSLTWSKLVADDFENITIDFNIAGNITTDTIEIEVFKNGESHANTTNTYTVYDSDTNLGDEFYYTIIARGLFDNVISYKYASESLSISDGTNITINLNDIITTDLIESNSYLTISNSTYSFNQTYNSTSGSFEIGLTPALYQITYYADGYAFGYDSFLVNETEQTINYNLYANNSVWVTAYDSDTGAELAGFTVEIFDSNRTYEANDTTGIAYLNNVESGVYTVQVDKEDYTTASYSLTMTGGSHQNLSAYLTQDDSIKTVIFTIVNGVGGQLIEDVTISQYKTVLGSWTLVSVKESDLTGRTQFSYSSSTEYQFIFSHEDYETRTVYLEPLFGTYTVTLTPKIDEVADLNTGDFYISITPSLLNDEADNNLTFSITSSSGTIEYYNITITAPNVSESGDFTNAVGGNHDFNFFISGASLGDIVTVDYGVKESGRAYKTFTRTIPIMNVNTEPTFFDKDSSNGVGLFETTTLATIVLLIITGIVATGSALVGVNPLIPSAFTLITFMVLFAMVGFIPMWSLWISGFSLLIIVIFSARSY